MSNPIKITAEQLDAIMPPGEYVHTFMQAGMTLFGADWRRSEILELAHSAELAGPQATAMNHGALVWQGKQPIFVETDPERIKVEGAGLI